MAEKNTWSKQLNLILESNASEGDVSSEKKWAELFALAKTFGNYHTACSWATSWSNKKWSDKFYQKARELSNGSFKHLLMVTQLASKKGDEIIFVDQLDKMLLIAQAGKVKNRCRVIMDFLPKSDKKYTAAKEHLKTL